jgi:hypothetical protein
MLSFDTTNKFKTNEKEFSQYETYLRIVEITNFGSPSPDEFSHIIHCNNHVFLEVFDFVNFSIIFTVENLKSNIQMNKFSLLKEKTK